MQNISAFVLELWINGMLAKLKVADYESINALRDELQDAANKLAEQRVREANSTTGC